ncbi:hypothetical protein Leryth_018757 [Lithospermum erythrorhizon]|nr:hypothetical protein Leryth_018757 [Lithospermum erythrorhizon]
MTYYYPLKMKPSSCFFIILALVSLSSFSYALNHGEAAFIARRQLQTLPENGDIPDDLESTIQVPFTFENDRLRSAFIALQAWKKAIYSDPNNVTSNWNGPDVCSYNGTICAMSPDGRNEKTVAGIDLNSEDIAGHLPVELGLLKDLSFFHINSNRFCGIVPQSISRLVELSELDLSNNRFVGPFPMVVLSLPKLIFLDLRFNEFEGPLPKELFDKKLDAVFLNNNRFEYIIPDNIGNSEASVMVLGNNKFGGCVPKGFAKMRNLEELILINSGLSGCFPEEITTMKNLTVLDLSRNKIVGSLPTSLNKLENLQEIIIGDNLFTGIVPEEICTLPGLEKLVIKDNYFQGMHQSCYNIKQVNITNNCFPGIPDQKSVEDCNLVLNQPIDCKVMEKTGCKPPKFASPSNKTNFEVPTTKPEVVNNPPPTPEVPTTKPGVNNPPSPPSPSSGPETPPIVDDNDSSNVPTPSISPIPVPEPVDDDDEEDRAPTTSPFFPTFEAPEPAKTIVGQAPRSAKKYVGQAPEPAIKSDGDDDDNDDGGASGTFRDITLPSNVE